MTTLREELAKVLNASDDAAAADSFLKFCTEHADKLPLPGEDSRFDQAMLVASQYTRLSPRDESILKRVTGKMLSAVSAPIAEHTGAAVLKLKDLIGAGKDAAINTWQDMLTAMAWQQMVPAGAMRGVGAQMVSLGTFQKQLADANVQVNIGWLVDKGNLRVLLQAKDVAEEGIQSVELRITEAERGVVFSRATNEDGSVVAPSVHVGPGKYQIQVLYGSDVAETPYFIV